MKTRKQYKKKPPLMKVCPGCGKEFATGGEGRPRKTQVFCNYVCRKAGSYSTEGGRTSSLARKMTKLEIAWFAGFFDGEGTILNTKRSTGGESWRIAITNTNRDLLGRVLRYAGTGAIHQQRAATERHSQCWIWECYALNAKNILDQILPWLIEKRPRAEEAIDKINKKEANRIRNKI